MRRISKPRPPKNVSADGQTACNLQQAEQQLHAALPTAEDPAKRARAHFDGLDKLKLRKVLYAEQRHICVYCQQRVKEGSDVPRIEHWRPLSHNPDLALCWTNLYLSCRSPGTCDGAKAERRLVWDTADPDLPWPTAKPYHDWIGFTSGGEAYVRVDAPLDDATRKALELAIADQNDGAQTRKSILNLNDPALVAAREAAIDGERSRMERDFPNRQATADGRLARAAEMLRETVYPAFVSIRVAWLRRTLGKHREPVR
jgi:uncharacterized protein (TIGR02646 family)